MAVIVYLIAILILYIVFNFAKIAKFVKKRANLYKHIGKLEGPLSLPLVGTAFQFKLDALGFSEQLYGWGKEYSEKGCSLAKFWIGPFPLIVVLKPDAVKTVLESNVVIDKSSEYDVFLPWLGTGLLLAGGSKWRQRRKMLTPSFHFNVLNDFQLVFDYQSKILLEKIEEQLSQTDTFDAFPFIKRCALDIICETAMGATVNAQTNHDHPYVKAVKEMNILAYEYQRKPWLWLKPIRHLTGYAQIYESNLNTVLSFTKSVIEQKMDDYAHGERADGKKKAFLDRLIEMKEEGGLSYEDIREEVDTFMFEGHDTTSAGIGWTLFCLATQPECQQKCQEELDEIFECSMRDCTIDDLRKMKYLDKCIKEALRLRPSVPHFARDVKEDFEIEGSIVPAGSSIFISPAFMHNNSTSYENPEKYDPERFNEENIAKRHPYSYIPFSAGPRNCIGQKFAMQEEKTVISWVLRKFKISTSLTLEENAPLPETILRPNLGFPFKFEIRL